MIVHVCSCGCFHGWMADKAGIVRLVTRHTRGAMEDIWWCPGCGREHRTHDGTALGQVSLEWRYATAEELALIEKGEDPRRRRGTTMIDGDGRMFEVDDDRFGGGFR